MNNETLLHSRPIKEVRINVFDQQYIVRVQWYLEHELQCRMTYMSEEGGYYLIRFPEGTVEEIYAGRSTQWTYETTIRFPNDVTLKKYSRAPLNETQKPRVDLAFPNSVLDGLKPSSAQRASSSRPLIDAGKEASEHAEEDQSAR